MSDSDNKARVLAAISRVRPHISVTKVVATRAVKTKRGDFFAGFGSAWDSTQDDVSGPGADLTLSPADDAAQAGSGMSLDDAKVAHAILSMEASIAAWRAALIDGAISKGEYDRRTKIARNNTYAILEELTEKISLRQKVA
jgi:hypothetical protein